MAKETEVRSSQFPFNMANWCSEKAEVTLRSVVLVLESIRQIEGISESDKNAIFSYLWSAIRNNCKLLAFSCGEDWKDSDNQCIFDEGIAGFEKVMLRYGIINETEEDIRRKRLQHLVSQIEALLDGSRSPNRTLLHELFLQNSIDHTLLTRLGEKLEKVTMGEITWNVFVTLARELIKELNASLNDNP